MGYFTYNAAQKRARHSLSNGFSNGVLPRPVQVGPSVRTPTQFAGSARADHVTIDYGVRLAADRAIKVLVDSIDTTTA
jgi:hypothetical protein